MSAPELLPEWSAEPHPVAVASIAAVEKISAYEVLMGFDSEVVAAQKSAKTSATQAHAVPLHPTSLPESFPGFTRP